MILKIEKANWDAVGLANYLNAAMTTHLNNSCAYDSYTMSIKFGKEVDILQPLLVQIPEVDKPLFDETANKRILSYLGYPTPTLLRPNEYWAVYNTMGSQIPIKLSGPSCIYVHTNLPLFNVPVSGRLATVGVDGNYGDLLMYHDLPSSQPAFLTAQYIERIQLQLTDENNEELEGYDDIPWSATITIDPVEDSGYVQMNLTRENVDHIDIL